MSRLVLSAVLSLAAGCSGGTEPGAICTSSMDCGPRERCVDRMCVPLPLDAGGRADGGLLVDGGVTPDAGCVPAGAESCNAADDDCDGTVDEALTDCATCTGDMCKLGTHPGWCTAEADLMLDGTVDRLWANVWDGAALLQQDYDSDADGTANRVTRYMNDAMGRVIGETRYDAMMVVTGTAVYIREPSARLMRVDFDLDNDGRVDQIQHYLYSGGLLTQLDVDLMGDGTVDQVWSYWYDDMDVLLRRERRVAGALDHVIHYSMRDAGGNVLVTEHDDGADGTPEERRRYEYGCWTAAP